jgi:hypothetical protein
MHCAVPDLINYSTSSPNQMLMHNPNTSMGICWEVFADHHARSKNVLLLFAFIDMRAIALYRCNGEDASELSFQAGDIIYKGLRT